MKLLKQLYTIHSPSSQEGRIKRFIKRHIQRSIPDCRITYDKIGNMYLQRGTAESYPCIVAHLDQVQRLHSPDFQVVETSELLIGYSSMNRRQEGLGADDKSGIWIALKCLSEYEHIKVALFVQEEVGCVGSSRADMSFFDDCRFVLQADRKGRKDIVTTINWTSLCSEEFLADAEPHLWGYEPSDGAITDVGELKYRGLPISCVNLSCGYYEPHTDVEFTHKGDLLNCLAFVESIIQKCTKVYHHRGDDLLLEEYSPWDEHHEQGGELWKILEEMLMSGDDLSLDRIYDQYRVRFPELERSDFELIRDAVNRQYFNY